MSATAAAAAGASAGIAAGRDDFSPGRAWWALLAVFAAALLVVLALVLTSWLGGVGTVRRAAPPVACDVSGHVIHCATAHGDAWAVQP